MGMWSGSESQSFPKWKPPGKGRPKYLVPRGVKCAVRDIRGGDWHPFVTTKESGFDRCERYEKDEDGSFYEFRQGMWLILIHRKYVVHRETVDEMEKRLRMLPEFKPKKPRSKKKRRR